MMVAAQFKVDPAEFAGRRVLVTGGTKGAGEAIMRRFRASGARTATSARSDQPPTLVTDFLFEPILQRSKASKPWRTPSYPALGVWMFLSIVLADRVRRAAVSWQPRKSSGRASLI